MSTNRHTLDASRTIVNPVIKDRVTFIRTAAETKGEYTAVEVMLMPGGGTPLHFHKVLIETFEVISGELSIQEGREKRVLGANNAITVPPEVVHRFSNESNEPVVFRTTIYPGSEGFEHSLRILYGLAADGLTDAKGIPKRLIHLAIIGAISDMHTSGIMSLFTPLFRVLAAAAKRNGKHQALIHRYCG